MQRLQEEEERRIRELTPFQPTASPVSKPQRYQQVESQFPDKWEYLHSDGLQKSKTFKRDTTRDEYEYLKEQDEYTF